MATDVTDELLLQTKASYLKSTIRYIRSSSVAKISVRKSN
ncbi:hypothetical protein CAL7102_04419 [Dulcicalothrix desertica PCC 7102]|nr:hypothetical protein CAL7102_04419 [Dulcicalothrix desertica PCC 7102]